MPLAPEEDEDIVVLRVNLPPETSLQTLNTVPLVFFFTHWLVSTQVSVNNLVGFAADHACGHESVSNPTVTAATSTICQTNRSNALASSPRAGVFAEVATYHLHQFATSRVTHSILAQPPSYSRESK